MPKTDRHRGAAATAALAFALALALVPAAAFAQDATAVPYDRADFYEEVADDATGAGAGATRSGASLLSVDLGATVTPRSISQEMLYFASFESGQDYDHGFSSGDGYHALGYYQFDNRYGLQSFLVACYNYDPATYSMLAWLKDVSVDLASEAMYDYDAGALTWIGQRVQDSWHAAYAANPTGFSRLQDGWYYDSYIQPALSYLNGRGLNMDGRRDCIKGLVSGVNSLFGSGGWRRFVGGYFNGVDYTGAGLTGDMTDRQFAVALCNYIVDHVAEFYPNQPQYHEGWQNRYRRELEIVLGYLGNYPDDVNQNDWYVTSGAYDFVTSNGYMNGYGNGYFGPYDTVTRAQVVTVLWHMAGSPQASSDAFSDADYGDYYGGALRWARAVGVANGYGADASGNVTFRPNAPVTREELAVMFANYAARVDKVSTWSNCARMDAIDGATDVADWARQAMGWAVDRGLVSGKQDAGGTFHLDPQGEAWRASLASIVYRYLS